MNADFRNHQRAITDWQRSSHLLDTIAAMRVSVRDGLDDEEFTLLLRENSLLNEAGFAFLCFSKGLVTLTVPEQDLTSWYSEEGWITPEKKRIAAMLAEKYELSLYEPVDTTVSFWLPESGSAVTHHHHLELLRSGLTVVVAHPHYLKVRLFGNSPHYRYEWETHCPTKLGPDLLQDCSALYGDTRPGDDPYRMKLTPEMAGPGEASRLHVAVLYRGPHTGLRARQVIQEVK